MAEETLKNAASESTTATVEAVLEVEKSAPTPPPEPEKSAPVAPKEEEKPKPPVEEEKIPQSVSFKEESNVASELPEAQKKALDELKQLIQDALNKHEFKSPPPPPPPSKEEEKPKEEKEKEKETDKKATEADEPAKEEKKTEATAEISAPATITEEAAKAEEKVESDAPVTAEETKEEDKSPETVVVETVSVAVVATDDDGAKTVEAIEESVVAVSAQSVEAVETPAAVDSAAPLSQPEEVSIWGIGLLQDDRSDVVLLKFLRARDFRVKDAFTMIRNTVRWREEFGIESLLTEDLGCDGLEKVVFMHGVDKEGHPVCYNVYGAFQNRELYSNTFSDEEKRQKFLRWRIQYLEKSIRKLDFSPSGISTIVQVNDLKNFPGPFKWELRQATNQALHLLQDNYPEFVAKQVFVNVPWWYLAVNKMMSPFFTQRTKSKFVFAGPSKSADALFRYVAPEQVPLQYGGLSKATKEEEQEFTTTDAVTEVTIKPASKHTVEFPFTEAGVLVWAVRVVGWDVNFGAEFVPAAEDGYTVIVQKTRKVTPSDETVIVDSFKIGEPGKVVLTIDNQSSKKKKLLYRSKTKPSSD